MMSCFSDMHGTCTSSTAHPYDRRPLPHSAGRGYEQDVRGGPVPTVILNVEITAYVTTLLATFISKSTFTTLSISLQHTIPSLLSISTKYLKYPDNIDQNVEQHCNAARATRFWQFKPGPDAKSSVGVEMMAGPNMFHACHFTHYSSPTSFLTFMTRLRVEMTNEQLGG